MDQAIILSQSNSFYDCLLKSVKRIIQKVLRKENKAVITPEATIGIDLGADSLDSQDIIISIENVWGFALKVQWEPGFGFLKIKVKELTQELVDSLKELFKVKDLNNPATVLKIHVRQSILSFLKKNCGENVKNESSCRCFISDDMKIVGSLYMSSDDIEDLEEHIRKIFGVPNKFHIMEYLNKYGDLRVVQLYQIIFRVLATKTKLLPRKRKDL